MTPHKEKVRPSLILFDVFNHCVYVQEFTKMKREVSNVFSEHLYVTEIFELTASFFKIEIQNMDYFSYLLVSVYC